MLFLLDIRVDPKDLSFDELWDLWEKETEASIDAKKVGKIVDLWKVAGQRRVVAVVDVESHDELDQILMGALPMAHNLEFLQILPLRAYDNFASDVRSRWKGDS